MKNEREPRVPRAFEQPRGRFSKSARVRKRREYLAIQNGGRRVSSPHFLWVIAARGATDAGPEAAAIGEPRLGVTASRKVGGATVRNRVRRVLREVFRVVRGRLPADLDLVVIVKRAPEGVNLGAVVDEFCRVESQILKRLGEARAARKSAG